MAVIRAVKTAGGRKLQVIVRKGGHALSRTFWRQREAEDWGRRVEDAIASATPTMPFDRKTWLPLTATEAEALSFDDGKPHGGWTVARALDEFKEKVSAKRKGAKEESYRIEFWKGTAVGRKKLVEVTAEDVQAIIDSRLTMRKGDTVRRETNVLRSLFKHARDGWKLQGLASLSELKLPKKSDPRERRLRDGFGEEKAEEWRLRAALATVKRRPEIHLALFDFALATGFRLSEAHRLTKASIHRVRGVVSAHLPDSKNGGSRTVILSSTAREIVDRLTEGQPAQAKLFRISDSARKRAWEMARVKAGVDDLRWHDLRHEAISRMMETLHLFDVMAQAGHRDVASTKGYSHGKASDIAKKLG